MNYKEYAARAESYIEEIYMLITEDDIAALLQYCRQRDKDDVLLWFGQNRARVSELATAAPSRKSLFLRACEAPERQLLMLCAVWFLRGSARVLQEIADNMLDAPDAYRKIAERAGDAWMMTVTQTLFDWPFDGISPWKNN